MNDRERPACPLCGTPTIANEQGYTYEEPEQVIEMIPKHEPPRTCRWRRALLGASPSAIFSTCLLGLRQTRKACEGCEMNVTELMQEGLAKGLRRRGLFGDIQIEKEGEA